MDIYEPLPDPETLDLASAKALRLGILTVLRPYLLRRLTALGPATATDLGARIDRFELETRLGQIDAHDWALDARITSAEEPTLAYHMCAEFTDLAMLGPGKATGRAALFYSPEAKFNVHGPIMLFHAAALAERVLGPGEALAHLESASFSKMVISQLRLTVFDPAQEPLAEHRQAIAGASLSGVFRLSSGRRLHFYGVQDHHHPVGRRCWINRIAMNLIPCDGPPERDGEVYRVRTPASIPPELWPEGGLGVPAQLMTVVDTLVMLMLTEHMHADETRLLLSVRDLPISPDMLHELVIDATIGFAPRRDKARRVGDTLVMMPTDIRFARRPDLQTRIMTGESTEPYYRMPVD